MALARVLPALALLLAAVAGGERAAAQDRNIHGNQEEPEPADELELGGRVFARDTVTTIDVLGDRRWSHERDVDSARLSFEYQRKDHLKLSVEVDFAGGDADLKDTYVRVMPGAGIRVQAGRFKRPMSIIGLTSKWDLPSTERGLLATLEVDGQDLPFSGGRGDGILVRHRTDSGWEPTLTLAVFQNPLGRGTSGIDASDELTQDGYLRFEVEPHDDLTLATAVSAIGYLDSPGDTSTFTHAPVASLEGFLDGEHLRVWLEGFWGRSMFTLGDEARGAFWATRTLVSVRAPRSRWPKSIEPFVLAAYFDPSTVARDDANAEVGGGLHLGFTKYWRLQVDATHRFASGDRSPAIGATVIRAQLGARFELDWESL